jgi:pseudouridine-5'-phosphate glycosidase
MSIEVTNEYLDITPEVHQALQAGQPVVALESTIICHGMPHPGNIETALNVEQMVRKHGAVPATIAILDGRLKVGLTHQQINDLGVKGKQVIKTSRRDIPFLVTRRQDGATTVAATMIIAAMAGIRVFATGGIGGVHRGVESTLDISADLEELSHTNVAVVCAGIKSVLDIGRTLEYLETHGVPVIGYQTDILPAFYTRDSEFAVDYRVDSAAEIAAIMHAKWTMGLSGGLVIANPVPEAYSLDAIEIEKQIANAIEQMNQEGVSGKDTTPFLLSKIAEQSAGDSLATNVQLVLNNARIAAEIACAASKTVSSA